MIDMKELFKEELNDDVEIDETDSYFDDIDFDSFDPYEDDEENELYFKHVDNIEKKVQRELPGWNMMIEGSWQGGMGSDFLSVYPPEELEDEFNKALEDAEEDNSINLGGDVLNMTSNEVINKVWDLLKSIDFEDKVSK